MSDAKVAIHGINIFHFNVIIIIIWKVICHATETLGYPARS